MSTDSSTPEAIRALVRDLLSEAPPGKGPIRIEDWNDWTSRQRWAYAQLRRWVGLNAPPTGE